MSNCKDVKYVLPLIMKTTANTVNVTTYFTPEVKVQMSNIVINPAKRTGIMTLSTPIKGKRKLNPEQVAFTMTAELYTYLTLMRDDKVQVTADNEKGYEFIPAGTRSTSFQRFLAKKGIEYKAGILKEMVFTCDNNSSEYLENPFRLVMYDNRDAVLTLVNLPSKKATQYVDESTGEISTRYSNKIGVMADGKRVKAFIHPTKYRRLVIQTITQREVYVAPVQ